jgi:hypothetical protein
MIGCLKVFEEDIREIGGISRAGIKSQTADTNGMTAPSSKKQRVPGHIVLLIPGIIKNYGLWFT